MPYREIEGLTTSLATLTETEKGYIAGIIDGEGYIGIFQHSHAGRVETETTLVIDMTSKSVIDWLHERMGGSVFVANPRPPNKLLMSWRLTLWRKEAAAILQQVRECLILKKPKAEQLIYVEAHRGKGSRTFLEAS